MRILLIDPGPTEPKSYSQHLRLALNDFVLYGPKVKPLMNKYLATPDAYGSNTFFIQPTERTKHLLQSPRRHVMHLLGMHADGPARAKLGCFRGWASPLGLQW